MVCGGACRCRMAVAAPENAALERDPFAGVCVFCAGVAGRACAVCRAQAGVQRMGRIQLLGDRGQGCKNGKSALHLPSGRNACHHVRAGPDHAGLCVSVLGRSVCAVEGVRRLRYFVLCHICGGVFHAAAPAVVSCGTRRRRADADAVFNDGVSAGHLCVQCLFECVRRYSDGAAVRRGAGAVLCAAQKNAGGGMQRAAGHYGNLHCEGHGLCAVPDCGGHRLL